MSTTPLSYVARSQTVTERQHLSLRRSYCHLLMRLIQEYAVYINQLKLCTSQQTV
ncbi:MULTISPECIES: hypothetical protein [Acinetobacter]|uniref:hypothetical protein n=1 Tax=Acinetobacter TaxID=469 RepID=UPI0012DB3112|nr:MULTISPECIES: hypothetical protein [Acinetobacter]MBM7142142.1 hypothetical protein [Acinetobacter sp. 105-3]